jgi:hypothetical protein
MWIAALATVALCAVLLLRFSGAFSGVRPDDVSHANGGVGAGADGTPNGSVGRLSEAPVSKTASVQTVPSLGSAEERNGSQAPTGAQQRSAGSNAGHADGGGSGAAVILADSSNGQAVGSGEAATLAPAPVAATHPSRDAMDLSVKLTPPAERKPSSKTSHAKGASDSDVSLLTVLLQHVEMDRAKKRGVHAAPNKPRVQPSRRRLDPVEALMQKCPAANTEAGLRCRRRICARHRGESKACPTALAGAGRKE